MITSERIETVKEFITSELEKVDVTNEISFQEDNDTGGYVYSISTKFGLGLFSDTGETDIGMYILNNQLYNWGKNEGLSEDQMMDLNLYIKIEDVSEFILYLSTPKLKPLR